MVELRDVINVLAGGDTRKQAIFERDPRFAAEFKKLSEDVGVSADCALEEDEAACYAEKLKVLVKGSNGTKGTAPAAPVVELAVIQQLVGSNKEDEALEKLGEATAKLFEQGKHAEAKTYLEYFAGQKDTFKEKVSPNKLKVFKETLKKISVADGSAAKKAYDSAIDALDEIVPDEGASGDSGILFGLRFGSYTTPMSLREEGVPKKGLGSMSEEMTTSLHGVEFLTLRGGAELNKYARVGLELGLIKTCFGHLKYSDGFGEVDEWAKLYTLPVRIFGEGSYDWGNALGVGGVLAVGTEFALGADTLRVGPGNAFANEDQGYEPDPFTNFILMLGPQFRAGPFRAEALAQLMIWDDTQSWGEMKRTVVNGDGWDALSFAFRLGFDLSI